MLSRIARLKRQTRTGEIRFDPEHNLPSPTKDFAWPVCYRHDEKVIGLAVYNPVVSESIILLVELDAADVERATKLLYPEFAFEGQTSILGRVAEVELDFSGEKVRVTDIRLFLDQIEFSLPEKPSVEFLLSKFKQLVMCDAARFSVSPTVTRTESCGIGKSRADDLGKFWADQRVRQGVSLQRDFSDFHGAIAHYEAALGLVPDHVDALVARGTAFIELDMLDDAVDSFGVALEIAPTNRSAIKYIQLARDLRSNR